MTELDEMLFYLDSLKDRARDNPYTRFAVTNGERREIGTEKDEIRLIEKICRRLKGAK